MEREKAKRDKLEEERIAKGLPEKEPVKLLDIDRLFVEVKPEKNKDIEIKFKIIEDEDEYKET